MSFTLCVLSRVVALCLLCLSTFALQATPPHEPWSAKSIELAGGLAVQEGGRIKPLSTYASFTLLRLSGKRSTTTAEGRAQGPVEWLLDTLYFPAEAAQARVFLVNDSAALEALGLKFPERRKRDRYTFHELEPGFTKLFSLAHDWGAIDAKQRSSVQTEVVNLAERVDTFLRLNRQETLALIPPDDDAVGEAGAVWLPPAVAFARLQGGEAPSAARQRLFGSLDALAGARKDSAAFELSLSELHATLQGFAAVRNVNGALSLERNYYRWDLLGWSLGLFVLGFLGSAVTWLRPQGRWLYRACCAVIGLATLALVAAIVVRCLIRGRPPVSTLYESVLFVTAVGTIVALVFEWIDRQRIACAAGSVLGLVGVFIANGYETLDAKDTMPSLVAVLDTNFWLATHVTAITIGYSAGLLAALLGSLYVLAKVLRPARTDSRTFATLGRMVYGVLCFGLLFSIVGTILGGIWANESWGRFWGWDPKENGALLIVISQLLILHLRMGGFVREFGLAIAAAAAGCVVAFSWWGVNLLGVGLHSYGFTSGIQSALSTYYGVQGTIVVLGVVALWRERSAKRASLASLPAAGARPGSDLDPRAGRRKAA